MRLVLFMFLATISLASIAQTAEEYNELAIQKMASKDFQYASLLMDKAIKLDGNNIWYWLRKAEIQEELQPSVETLSYIRKAISIEPLLAEPYNRAAMYYESRGISDSAVLMYDLAIKHAEDDTIKYAYLMNRGASKVGKMAYKEALVDFEKVLEFDPDNIACLTNISNVYKKLGNIEKSIVTMERVIELDPDFLGPYINLGLLYAEIDSLNRSIEYFDKAVVISPEEPLLFSNRGFTYYKMGKYDAALNDVNRSIKLYPTNSYAYKYLALIYFAQGSNYEGCKALDYATYYGYEKRYGQEVNELTEKHCKK